VLALLKAEEVSVVGKNHIERFAAASDEADAQAALGDTHLGAYLESAGYGGSRQRDDVLWRYLASRIASLEGLHFLPPDARSFSRAYVLKYDVANVKAVLQGLALEREPALLPIGVIAARRQLDELAAAETIGEVVEVLMRTGLALFAPVIRSFHPAAGPKARRAIEAGLEDTYHRHLLHTAHGLVGGVLLAKACGMMIDFANLSIFFRALLLNSGRAAGDAFVGGGYLLEIGSLQEALMHEIRDAPRRLDHHLYLETAMEVVDAWEKSGSVASVDQVIERHRFAALRSLLAPQVAPAAVMAWFLIVKEIELRNVSLLFKSIGAGATLDDVRKHLLW
jgi:vacuolar-type H+-ATPase subunit C/Vma6